jgi:putative sterol carrier protein
MPDIYTPQWYEALRDLLNRNPDVERNAPRGRYRVLATIAGDSRSAYLELGDVRHFEVVFADGKCLEYRQIETPPARRELDFIFELPATVFEGVAAGLIDLVDAGLKGKIKITGDMRILIRHAELVNALYDVYAREVETLWPRGKPASTEYLTRSAAAGGR